MEFRYRRQGNDYRLSHKGDTVIGVADADCCFTDDIQVTDMEGYWIGPFWYDVEEKAEAEMKEDVGNCVWWTHEIWVRRNLKPEVRRRILMHEIMEAIGEIYGLSIEHKVLDAIGNAFMDLLESNGGCLPGVVDEAEEC